MSLVTEPPSSSLSVGGGSTDDVTDTTVSKAYTGSYTSFQMCKNLQRPSPTRRQKHKAPVSPVERLRASRKHNSNKRRHHQQPLSPGSSTLDRPSSTSKKKKKEFTLNSEQSDATVASRVYDTMTHQLTSSFEETMKMKLSQRANHGGMTKDPSVFRSAMSSLRAKLQRPMTTAASFHLQSHQFEKSTLSWNKKTRKKSGITAENYESHLKREDFPMDGKAKITRSIMSSVERAIQSFDDIAVVDNGGGN